MTLHGDDGREAVAYALTRDVILQLAPDEVEVFERHRARVLISPDSVGDGGRTINRPIDFGGEIPVSWLFLSVYPALKELVNVACTEGVKSAVAEYVKKIFSSSGSQSHINTPSGTPGCPVDYESIGRVSASIRNALKSTGYEQDKADTITDAVVAAIARNPTLLRQLLVR